MAVSSTYPIILNSLLKKLKLEHFYLTEYFLRKPYEYFLLRMVQILRETLLLLGNVFTLQEIRESLKYKTKYKQNISL